MADLAVEDDVIEAEERELIESVIEFGDTVVREVMVPRPDMVTVTADFRVADAMEVVILNGYSRIPVCGDGIDDIVGRRPTPRTSCGPSATGTRSDRSAELARPAHFVPETKRVADAAAGDAAGAVPHGDRRRRVRRHRRPRHPRGPHRGAARRDRRRVRRRGPDDRAAARRRRAGQRPHAARRGQRAAARPAARGRLGHGRRAAALRARPRAGRRRVASRSTAGSSPRSGSQGRRIGRVRVHRLPRRPADGGRA